MQVTVADVMTRAPVSVPAEATIEDVLQTLVSQGLPSVYVTTAENRLAGVVTDYEVLKHQVLHGDRTQTAASLMCRSVPTVRADENALAMCPSFRDGRFARVAVIDGDGKLIGNLSRADVMRMMLTLERLEADGQPAAASEPAESPEERGDVRSSPGPHGVASRKPILARCP